MSASVDAEARWQAEGKRLVDRFDRAFSEVSRPHHFTNHGHCPECADHDEALRSHDRRSLPLEVVNHPSWPPLCFITPEGLRYYIPTLVRLGFGPGGKSFMTNFVAFLRCSSAFGPMELDREQLEAIVDLVETVASFATSFDELSLDREAFPRVAAAWSACLSGAPQPFGSESVQ